MTTSESGIFCPACKMKNEPNTVVCTYCKTPLQNDRQKTVILRNPSTEVTGSLPDSFNDFLDAPIKTWERFMDFEIPTKGILLINIEDSQPIVTLEDNEFILGRASEEIKIQEHLVDLSAIGALEYGISRLHARIRKTRDGYQITDLNSSNGTWLENQRLVPQKTYPLQSGERIRMGRLNILVYFPKRTT